MKNIWKIVLTGPESTGKTTLAQRLASLYQEPWVPEFARSYIDALDRPYKEEDLEIIARGHLTSEQKLASEAKQLLICDTDLLTIKIWSEVKYGTCAPFILEAIETRVYDLYLLCKPDFPWQADPQREHPEQRAMLYDRYKKELFDYGKNFVEIGGSINERFQEATLHISSINT